MIAFSLIASLLQIMGYNQKKKKKEKEKKKKKKKPKKIKNFQDFSSICGTPQPVKSHLMP